MLSLPLLVFAVPDSIPLVSVPYPIGVQYLPMYVHTRSMITSCDGLGISLGIWGDLFTDFRRF
jgi:hypothetical protein